MIQPSVSKIQNSSQDTPIQDNIDVLAKDAVTALTIQGAGLVLMYLVQVFLAQWMGIREYGIYEYVIRKMGRNPVLLGRLYNLICNAPRIVGQKLTICGQCVLS